MTIIRPVIGDRVKLLSEINSDLIKGNYYYIVTNATDSTPYLLSETKGGEYICSSRIKESQVEYAPEVIDTIPSYDGFKVGDIVEVISDCNANQSIGKIVTLKKKLNNSFTEDGFLFEGEVKIKDESRIIRYRTKDLKLINDYGLENKSVKIKRGDKKHIESVNDDELGEYKWCNAKYINSVKANSIIEPGAEQLMNNNNNNNNTMSNTIQEEINKIESSVYFSDTKVINKLGKENKSLSATIDLLDKAENDIADKKDKLTKLKGELNYNFRNKDKGAVQETVIKIQSSKEFTNNYIKSTVKELGQVKEVKEEFDVEEFFKD